MLTPLALHAADSRPTNQRAATASLSRGALAALAAATVVLHLVADAWSPYGIHRDELLYLAMGRHLRLWAMDFPPFMALAAQATRALALPFGGERALGTSMALLRLLPALAAGAIVLLAALVARALGGGRAAQLLAAACVLASPLYMRTGALFHPVVFDQLWWTLALYALVRIGRSAEDGSAPVATAREWLLLGAALGLGLLTKFSVAFIAIGVVAGVLATPLRRALGTPWPWAAALLALLIGSPGVVGQVRLGWPLVGQMAALRASQLVHVGPAEFLGGQLLFGPQVLLAAFGVWALLARPALRAGRAAAVACVVAFALLLLGHGKSYYIGPIYPSLWAAGAVALAADVARWRTMPGWRPRVGLAVAAVGVALVALYGVVSLPLGVPILPPVPMARYAAALGVGTETNTGGHLTLPQDFADMLGWPEQAQAAARVLHALPAADQARAVVAGGNYGEAGAIELYGPPLGVSAPISSAGSYWFFGPGPRAGDVLVVLADSAHAARDLPSLYARVRPVARAIPDSLRPWVVPEQRNAWVFVCDGPRQTLQQVWPSLAGRN
ncbi:MAG TPA: glycosyltransferase family 39 protein [Gemmatirosa sp.]